MVRDKIVQRCLASLCRAVGRSKNPGVPVVMLGQNLTPLVEIGQTDMPKSGGAIASQAPSGTTGLLSKLHILQFTKSPMILKCDIACMYMSKGQ